MTSGNRFRNVSISVRQSNETYKTCGKDINVILIRWTISFLCEYKTIGTSLKIALIGRGVLTLCEVQMFGKGIIVHTMILHCN